MRHCRGQNIELAAPDPGLEKHLQDLVVQRATCSAKSLVCSSD